MASYKTENIKNMVLLGHTGSGKTTLNEALLYASGEISQQGSIEKGNTVSDFDDSEIQLQHSIDCSLASFDFQGSHVNLLDTPGYPDFYNRTLSVLPAVETAAVVINAQNGVELITQRAMESAKQRQLCRLVVVNKIDNEGIDYGLLLKQLQQAFGKECLPLNLPANNGKEVVDCFFEPDGADTDFSSIAEAHAALVDQVVEVDEELMELYLEQGQSISPEQLHDPFEQALREGHLIPVCFVSAREGTGIPQLLNIINKLMPNPYEGNPPLFCQGEQATAVQLSHQSDAHALAHVFKVIINPFFGRLGIFRIHQGRIENNSQLLIGDARKPFKVNHLLKLQGKKHTEITAGIVGDICAVAKVDDIFYDAVLHDHHDEDHFYLKPCNFIAPMYGLVIEVSRLGAEQKLSECLQKLVAEDPALKLEHRPNLEETVLYGSSELHLRTVLEKIRRHYQLEVTSKPPSIAYRETISCSVEEKYRHKKQSGGSGQFGEVSLKVEPLSRGEGIEFVNKIVGGAIPSQFIPAVEKGVNQAIESGVLAGYPMQDIRITLIDGKHHSVDSKEVAFVAAGKKAFIEAALKARPKILEPIVNMEVAAPSDNVGDISSDVLSMRGMITGTTMQANNRAVVECQVPLSEIDDYQSRLNAETGGVGTYNIELAHYSEVTDKIKQQLIDNYQSRQ
jgi:elongation factor G